jgi:hypothetical protein
MYFSLAQSGLDLLKRRPFFESETNMKKLFIPALIAGLAGGFAEMAWVALYSSITSTSSMEVARQVTGTVFSSASNTPWAPWAGMGIHLALSLALGVAFVLVLWCSPARRVTAKNIWIAALLALVGIWAANFFIVLPALNGSFVTLMPYGATLLSKALFAVAMAAVLQNTAARVSRRSALDPRDMLGRMPG